MDIFDKSLNIGQARIYDGISYTDMVDSAKVSLGQKHNRPVTIFKDQLLRDMHTVGEKIFRDKHKFVNDAGVTNMGAYLEYQLTYVVPQVLTVMYPEQPAMELFSISNEGSLEKVILRRMKTYSGKHTREHENKTNNRGVITVAYSANGMRVEDFGATSTYTQRDLLRSAQLNDAIDSSLISGHDQSYKTWINDIAFLGMKDEQENVLVEGLLNNSQVHANVSIDATYAFNNASASGFQAYKDIKDLYNALVSLAGNNPALRPDTIVSSPRVITYLVTTTYGTSTVGGGVGDVENITTVAEMVKRLLGITELRSTVTAELLDGVGTTDRLCMFKRSSDAMVLHVPKPLTFSEVFKRGFRFEIESEFFVAGLNIFRDTVFGYLKGC